MLTMLRIKNLALVADLTLELQPGLNVITGETGAGKSIIIGALNLILGERADRSLIRSGADACSVEAVFDVSKLSPPLISLLDEHGLERCEESQLVVKRSLAANGANRQFVNGSPATLNVLAALGQRLVDLHGPHEHQSLLYPHHQLAILDAFAGLQTLRETFAASARRCRALEAEKTALIMDEKAYAQQVDLLRYQTNEITAAKLRFDEEERVELEHRRASNSARRLELSQSALNILNEAEGALLAQTTTLGRVLQELQRLDPDAASLVENHKQVLAGFHELLHELSHYADRLDLDPARLRELEERLNVVQALKRKYGATLAEVIAFGEDAQRKLHSLEQREAELGRINSDLHKLEAELIRCGKELSAQRRKVIPRLRKAVMKQLADLGFKQSQFNVAMTTLDPLAHHASPIMHYGHGLDEIEFQFAPNPGEPEGPLRAIASSGEIARVMLALKTVLAAQDEIPVLIFDEVDANVGGETAQAIGAKMLQIGRQRQVLCVTHLAPVAARGCAHYLVTKEVRNARTISTIALLDRKSRITELARMLGGQSAAARKHAEELLEP